MTAVTVSLSPVFRLLPVVLLPRSLVSPSALYPHALLWLKEGAKVISEMFNYRQLFH